MVQCKIPLAFYANKISSFCLIIACRSLANREPVKINQACWLTTANRLFCLYVSTLNPSDDFLEIVNFIVTEYVPIWFFYHFIEKPDWDVLCNNKVNNFSIVHGSLHVYAFLRMSRKVAQRSQCQFQTNC